VICIKASAGTEPKETEHLQSWGQQTFRRSPLTAQFDPMLTFHIQAIEAALCERVIQPRLTPLAVLPLPDPPS
jgi:hypothetical protein